MSFSQVRCEGHSRAATIYVAGMLEQLAATRVESAIRALDQGVRTIRVDLRAVRYIDPDCFVRVARSLSSWHERSGGQITIAFPAQSEISLERRSVTPAVLLRQETASGREVDRV